MTDTKVAFEVAALEIAVAGILKAVDHEFPGTRDRVIAMMLSSPETHPDMTAELAESVNELAWALKSA